MLLAIWDHDVGAAPERQDVPWVLALAGWAAWISLQILRGADGRKAPTAYFVAFFQGPEHCNERSEVHSGWHRHGHCGIAICYGGIQGKA